MSWVKDYLSFTEKERNALLVLIVIIAAFIFLPEFYSPVRKVAADPHLQQAISEMRTARKNNVDDEWQTTGDEARQSKEVKLFTFDPNSLDEAGFVSLGLPERTARTIINYRNKGGRFRKPEDLRKIYSLKKEDADRIVPYARIAEQYANQYPKSSYSPRERYNNVPSVIDINEATIEEWKALPGIGDVLSARIARYRESIGGFSSIQQVAKTYGLRDSTFRLILPYLRLREPAVNKVDINTAFEKELQECAGITPDVAKAIVIYRKQHGNFQSVEDLRKIVFITAEMFSRIAPCVVVK
ncbi:MAG: hypothetical protein K0Q66_145 [Chitinophagaceae bacterium]|jgi:competence ComEA-like helix-hairpin-helix protein|nr:hypothetical protein [Chitinophagaceae bacterium]